MFVYQEGKPSIESMAKVNLVNHFCLWPIAKSSLKVWVQLSPAKLARNVAKTHAKKNHILHLYAVDIDNGKPKIRILYILSLSIYIYICVYIYNIYIYIQWPFQEPKLEVPTIYKAHVRPPM